MKNINRFIPLLLLTGLILSLTLYFRAAAHRTRLESSLQAVVADKQRADLSLTEAQARTNELRQQLTALDEALGATKVRLTTSENRNIEQARETARLRQQLGDYPKQVAVLENELSAARSNLAEVQARSLLPADRTKYEETIARLEQELTAATEQLNRIRSTTVAGPAQPAFTTSRGRTASVVSVGPANAFVVINYGANHGALPTQIMQIRRGTDTLATVRISDVHPQYSVAQVLPDSVQGALHKGDLAVLSPSTP